ncbi:MAG: hypothetical protein QW785_01100 [Candidatus Anstonellales archaeon]
MGGTSTITKIVVILFLLFISGCIQSQNSVIIQDACCQKIVDGKCVEISNVSDASQILSDIIIIDGGQCSDLSRLCYNMNVTYRDVNGTVNMPYCKYANINNCETGFTLLVYDTFQINQKVNYDPYIQLFMFNNSSPIEQGEEIKQKNAINLLYGTLSRKFVGKYDWGSFNIYGTKFGVGDSIDEYEHYKYFFPFDYDYQGIEGINPIFYNIDLNNPRKCTIKENTNIFTCGGKDYDTWENCLLLCEMSDTSAESLDSFYQYRYNHSYGYERITFQVQDSNNVLKDENLYELLMKLASLDKLTERYPVGLMKTFAQREHPNFFHNITLNKTEAKKGWSISLGCFLGFGGESTYQLEPGNYTIYVERGSITDEPIYNFYGENYYRRNYYFRLVLKNLSVRVDSKSCFILCSCSSRSVKTDLTYDITLREIIIEKRSPMYIMNEIAKKYYTRFGFNTTNIDRPFIQRFDRTTGSYYNFSGLPFECVYDNKTFSTCSVEYYTRYTCVDALSNKSLDCWCDTESCYAYFNYSGPMLKAKTGLEAKPTINYNLSGNIVENELFIPKRLIKLRGLNAVVIPVNKNLDFDNYRLKRACFDGSNIGSDEIILCEAANPGPGCPQKDTEDWNRTFKRYDFSFEDISYLSHVVLLIDKNGDGNYGRCKGINVTKGNENYLDLEIRMFGIPIPPNPALNSIVVSPKYLGDDGFEYSGKEMDNIRVARFACVRPDNDIGYGNTKDYGKFGTKNKYEDGSFAFDEYGRLIGCYRGTIAINRSIDGEILFKSRRQYDYGLYKHIPNTRDMANYLLQGRQILFFQNDLPNDYLKRVLREVDTFLLIDGRFPRPFIRHASTPLGAIILVSNQGYNTLKNICPTCLIARAYNIDINGGSISGNVNIYGSTKTIDVSNNLPLACPGVRNSGNSDSDVILLILRVNSVNSDTGNALLNRLEQINTQSGGMPIYIYINSTSSIATKQFVDLLVNISHNLSSKGVMGVHIGNVREFFRIQSNSYYSANELSRSILSTITRIPIPYEVGNDSSECKYIIDRNTPQPITCLPDITPQLRSNNLQDVFPQYSIVADYNNFNRYAREIAISNYYSDKQICIRATDGRLFTYKLTKDYTKGPNPVIYDEIGNRTFDFVEYRYSNTTNMVCLPAKCRYELESFCTPSQCHVNGSIINVQSSIYAISGSLFIGEYFPGKDKCSHNIHNLVLVGFGSFTGRDERPDIVENHCLPSNYTQYTTFVFYNYTINSIINNNCSAQNNGYYIIKDLISNTSTPYPISYQQQVYDVVCNSWCLGFDCHSSECKCSARTISLYKNPIPQPENYTIRDDSCQWLGDHINASYRTRVIQLPPIFNINYTEVYNADWCVQRYILRCDE